MSWTICRLPSTPTTASPAITRRQKSNGNVIHYSRTLEYKELSVPVARADELKKFYRIIAGDERSTVVLKTK